MTNEMGEKCIRNLPPVRVSDALESALMRHAMGHAAMLPRDDEGGQ